MKNRYSCIFVLIALVLFSACASIHEFPDTQESKIEVNISLKFDVRNLRNLDSDNVTQDFSDPTDNIRVIISLYQYDNLDQEVDRRIVYLDDSDMNLIQLRESFTLEVNKYICLIWVDYVDICERADKFHITTDLRSVYFVEPLFSSTDTKDCLSGITDVDLTTYRNQKNVSVDCDVTIKRHVAKYVLIANDLDKFITLAKGRTASAVEFFTAKVMYTTYMPNSYNVHSGQPNDSKPGLWYESRLRNMSNGEVLICFDYPLVAQENTTVQLQILDQDGKIVNEVGDIRIPIARDSLTIIRSDFLSRQYSPGISIDPNWRYDPSLDIVLPD